MAPCKYIFNAFICLSRVLDTVFSLVVGCTAFIRFFLFFPSNLVANCTLSIPINPVHEDTPHTTPVPGSASGSNDPESDTPSPSHINSNRVCVFEAPGGTVACGNPPCWVPPPSLGEASQLCLSHESQAWCRTPVLGVQLNKVHCLSRYTTAARHLHRLFDVKGESCHGHNSKN